MELRASLSSLISGEVETSPLALKKYSRDASLFEITPKAVVFPKNVKDIEKLVHFVSDHSAEKLSLTARSAGTDMSGGTLTDSIQVEMTKHFDQIKEIGKDFAVTEPGVYYRDFEREMLKHHLLLPSYPASRELCTVGGMAANNSGGEKTLKYGKTEDYVLELKAVLADGQEYVIKPLNARELDAKIRQDDFEGHLYQSVYNLVNEHYDVIKKAKPKVSKNSTGYNLWDVWDRKTFDLTKLLVGSQGTLGIITEIKYRLVKPLTKSQMLVIFLENIHDMVKVIDLVLPEKPESFESYDDHTFKLALKYLPEIIKLIKPTSMLKLGLSFLPEFLMLLTGGMPKLVMLAEFTSDDQGEALTRAMLAQAKIKHLNVKTRIITTADEARKYWVIRRESFNLLRHHIRGRQTAPFIDDLVVSPESLGKFWPQLNLILNEYRLTYTVAGHMGDGNFHIIPLMKLSDPKTKDIITELGHKVYDLVFKFKGSMSGEHNDGLIRSGYLPQMYGDEVYNLFVKTKQIFDPKGIFNPGKKIGVSLEGALTHIKHTT